LDRVLTDLKGYLDQLTRLVYLHHGEVDKYLGDGFLAIFANADDAVQAGSTIQQAAAEFNRHQSVRGGLVFPSRVAIDTGQVAVTSLGSCNRQERTVIGMPVNLAERLQAQATPGRVWLSQATFDRLQDRSGYRCLGAMKVKGKAEPVVVYEKG
jgi:class 3 adenylate cyclase